MKTPKYIRVNGAVYVKAASISEAAFMRQLDSVRGLLTKIEQIVKGHQLESSDDVDNLSNALTSAYKFLQAGIKTSWVRPPLSRGDDGV